MTSSPGPVDARTDSHHFADRLGFMTAATGYVASNEPHHRAVMVLV